ncbi:MAG: gliding motility-associated C-terminal domain-containing protein, partial [Flavobacteriales bacterium]
TVDVDSTRVLGDTTYVLRNKNCEYVVEDISKKIIFPDSLKNVTYSQFPLIGDTIKEMYIPISLFFHFNNKIDTFYYEVGLRCITTYGYRQFVSPNGDGINDCWIIPELEKYPKNVLKLFNRWGNLVYEKEGYINHFCGVPNIGNLEETAEKDGLLPEGTYFFIIELGDSTFEPYTG